MSARDDLRRETLAKHPVPPTTPLEALAHVLAIFSDTTDDAEFVVTATSGIYGDRVRTGLTFGDLRHLRDEVVREVAAELWTKTLLADDCACVELVRAMATSAPAPVESAGDETGEAPVSQPDDTEYGLRMPNGDVSLRRFLFPEDRQRMLADGAVSVQRSVRYGAWTEVR